MWVTNSYLADRPDRVGSPTEYKVMGGLGEAVIQKNLLYSILGLRIRQKVVT
jgi:hypothetical protein